MLTSEAIQSAIPLSSIVEAAGMTVMPIEGTPLAELVIATRTAEHFKTQTGQAELDLDFIEVLANAPVSDEVKFSEHDIALDSAVPIIAKAVRNHLTFARTVVVPVVEELIEKTKLSIASLTPASLLGMEVIIKETPKPFLNASFTQSVERFAEGPFLTPARAMKLPTIPVSEIIGLMKTGAGNVDTDIEMWAASKGADFFIRLWEMVFQVNALDDVTDSLTFNDILEDRTNGAEYALAVYLITRTLFEQSEPMPGVEMTLEVYEDLVIQYRNQAAKRVMREIGRYDSMMKNGNMVVSSTRNKITVNDELYRKWIAEGGENEMLFGNLLNTPVYTSIQTINEHAAELKLDWNRFAVLQASVEKARRFARIKDALHFTFRQQLRDMVEGEAAVAGNVDVIMKRFDELLETIREAEIDTSFSNVCLKLVHGARFPYTSADKILFGINKYLETVPGINPREAAAMATLEYICAWVASMMRVE
jgi:hypothetical protein